ncbi:MAG: hypothetical protein OXC62_04355 [Aestuariivita sp.]|nr:hypothetical protein [Aestuariivita sp.]
MDASPQRPIYSTKSAHIIIWGIMQTSAPPEPLGLYAHARDRIEGDVRCAVFVTDQQSERRYRTTNDTRLSPHPNPERTTPIAVLSRRVHPLHTGVA